MSKSIRKKKRIPCNLKKCPKKDKSPHFQDVREGGNNIGNGGTLRGNIYKEFYPSHYTTGSDHPFSEKNGPAAQAHHLICSQAMKGKDWRDFCFIFGYDINCFENGVILPASMRIACKFGVPLHKGNHSNTITSFSLSINYVAAVEKLITPILNDFKGGFFCDESEDPVDDLNDISKEIWMNVKSFSWTLTFEGQSFMPGNITGCCQATKMKRFRKNFKRGVSCHLGGNHSVISPSGLVFLERGAGIPKSKTVRISKKK